MPTADEYYHRGHTTPEQRQRFWQNSVGPGWQKELVDPFLEVWRLAPPECEVGQIKEKFATLRVYVSGPEWWQKLADAIEVASEGMCEECGRRGGTWYGKDPETTVVKVTNHGWVKSSCQFCDPSVKETEAKVDAT